MLLAMVTEFLKVFFDSLLACFENCAEPFLLSGQNSSQRQRA